MKLKYRMFMVAVLVISATIITEMYSLYLSEKEKQTELPEPSETDGLKRK